jgi:hypothetical protein
MDKRNFRKITNVLLNQKQQYSNQEIEIIFNKAKHFHLVKDLLECFNFQTKHFYKALEKVKKKKWKLRGEAHFF